MVVFNGVVGVVLSVTKWLSTVTSLQRSYTTCCLNFLTQWRINYYCPNTVLELCDGQGVDMVTYFLLDKKSSRATSLGASAGFDEIRRSAHALFAARDAV